eukprot:1980566-Rhodomonas_salina.2
MSVCLVGAGRSGDAIRGASAGAQRGVAGARGREGKRGGDRVRGPLPGPREGAHPVQRCPLQPGGARRVPRRLAPAERDADARKARPDRPRPRSHPPARPDVGGVAGVVPRAG